MTGRTIRRLTLLIAAMAVTLIAPTMTAAPAEALNLPQVPVLKNNPNPGTDLFVSIIAVGTGGTERLCATSNLGIPVHCVEHTTIQPSASPDADATTYAHWIFCVNTCSGHLLVHEMVHVAQFEKYGDVFGPAYLAEAAQHGSGCENKWEKPAYQTDGRCL